MVGFFIYNIFIVKSHSEETKQKIRESRLKNNKNK